MRIIILCLISLLSDLVASDQLILVSAESFDTPSGVLQRFERRGARYEPVGDAFKVNLGRNGLGWGLGEPRFEYSSGEPIKHEGDGRAPAGVFRLTSVFGYAPHAPTRMPYTRATKSLICVDDADSTHYNTVLEHARAPEAKSFERMRRDDAQYALGVVVAHNAEHTPGRGSCIFLHVERAPEAPTAGCTSMPESRLRSLIEWLNPAKTPLLVQIPLGRCVALEKLYPGVRCFAQ